MGTAHADQMDARHRRLLTLCLLAWAVATGFLRLGAAPVSTNNEAREGVYVRAMLDTGDWVLPQVPNHVENGETIPDKPPLLHWISASVAWVRTALATGSMPTGREVSRRFDEWSLRFPSVMCGVLMVMSIAIRGRRILGDRAALLAAASLLMSLLYIQESQYGRVDMTTASFVTVSMLLLGDALLNGSKRALLAAAAASGLAVLGKGPVGLALPVLAGTAWIVIESVRRSALRWALELPWGSAVVVWAVVALPWYFGAYVHGGMAFVRSQLLDENFHQYAGGNGAMPWWYYVEAWCTTAPPWNVLGLLGVVVAWRMRDRRALFCATWWLAFLAFFQASAYKRFPYLLPALPAGAMMSGYLLDAKLPQDYQELRALATFFRSRWWKPALVLGLGAFVVGGYGVSVRKVVELVGGPLRAVDGGLFVLASVVAITSLVLSIRAIRARRMWAAVAALWIGEAALFHGVVTTVSIVLAERSSAKPLVARLVADLPAGETVTARGFANDHTLVPLLYFPDPARFIVVPEGQPLPPAFTPGFYLFTPAEWRGVQRANLGPPGAWHVLWTQDFTQRGRAAPFVFVEHRS